MTFSLALVLAAAIGFSLSVLGSGGSIITLPVLVYIAQVPVQQAIGMSLAIVGGTSLAASLFNARNGLIHARAAWIFSLTGVLGALAGSQLTHLVSPTVLMLLFGGLMGVVGALMLRYHPQPTSSPAKECRWQRCAITGFLVGGMTGFLGVGGGFLLVPAMVFFGRLSIKVAIATSLVVITINSLAGIFGHLQREPFSWKTTGMFLGAALIGMLIGQAFAGKIAADNLRRAFAWFVLGVSAYIIARSSGLVG